MLQNKKLACQQKEETSMLFYTKQHQYYCGIDLHEKTMYICIVDQSGKIRFHRNLETSREEFLAAIAPYREDICVGIESTYAC